MGQLANEDYIDGVTGRSSMGGEPKKIQNKTNVINTWGTSLDTSKLSSYAANQGVRREDIVKPSSFVFTLNFVQPTGVAYRKMTELIFAYTTPDSVWPVTITVNLVGTTTHAHIFKDTTEKSFYVQNGYNTVKYMGSGDTFDIWGRGGPLQDWVFIWSVTIPKVTSTITVPLFLLPDTGIIEQ